MSEGKTMKFSAPLYRRLKALDPSEREVIIAAALDARVARALIAPVEPPVEAASVVAETKAQVALPEPGELVPRSPGAGSPVVAPKTIWLTGRSGLGEPATWPGAVVHLPPDCKWFLDLDDASRAEAARMSLARCREVSANREKRLASLGNPEGIQRPEGMPKNWEPVTVWLPPAEACWPVRIQEHVVRSLGIEKKPDSFDLDAFISERKAKAAKKQEGAQ